MRNERTLNMEEGRTQSMFRVYQETCRTTDLYPEESKLQCLVLGLASEAGEVAGLVKKMYRDTTPLPASKMAAKIGGVMWYVARLLDECGLDFAEVLAGNLNKLERRKERGTLTGSGDDR